MEILRTVFAWFDLPWRDLTYENMFDRAKDLKAVDKEAIRYSRYVPLGQAGKIEEQNNGKQVFNSKLQERLARMADRAALGDEQAKARVALDQEQIERKMTIKRNDHCSPERLSALASPKLVS